MNRRETELDFAEERWFRMAAFDFTCQYGMNPWAPLSKVLLLGAACWFLYMILIHLPSGQKQFGIELLVRRSANGTDKRHRIRMWSKPASGSRSRSFKMLQWLRFEWRVLRAGIFLSLLNTFNIGFREINLGHRLSRLTKREYALEPVGWARTVTGLQALISVFLIALWVLTYFGRPFSQ